MIRKKILSQKFLMSFVCVLFTAILSLCSINIYNYSTYLSASTSESVELEDEETTNDDSESDIVSDDSDEIIDDTEDKVTAQASGTWDDYYATSFAGGSGTSSRPWLISTAAQLARVAYMCENYSSYRDDYYSVTANINLSAHYWVPIKNFHGNFDGNDYEIYGFTIAISEAIGISFDGYTNSIGLFAALSSSGGDAYIHNVIIDGSINFTSVRVFDWSATYAGGIAGKIEGNGILIYRCVSKVNITGFAAGYHIGGIVGYMSSDSGYSNIEQCMNFGNLRGRNEVWPFKEASVGGIVGYILYRGEITNCANYGSVNNTEKFAGGILGWTENYCYLYYVANFGSVTGGDNSSACTGGLVGQLGYGKNSHSTSIYGGINYGTVNGSGHLGRVIGYKRGNMSQCTIYAPGSSYDYFVGTKADGSEAEYYYTTTQSYIYSFSCFNDRNFSISQNSTSRTWAKMDVNIYFNNDGISCYFPILSFYLNSITVRKNVENISGNGYSLSSSGGSIYPNNNSSYSSTSSSETYYFATSLSSYTLFRFVPATGFTLNGWYDYYSDDFITSSSYYSASTYDEEFKSVLVKVDRLEYNFSKRIHNVYSQKLFNHSENSDFKAVNTVSYNGNTMTISSVGGTMSFRFTNSTNGEGLYGNTITVTLTPNENYEVLGLFNYYNLNSMKTGIYIGSRWYYEYNNSYNVYRSFNSRTGVVTYTIYTTNSNINDKLNSIQFSAIFVRYRYETNITINYETDRKMINSSSQTGYSDCYFTRSGTNTSTVEFDYYYGFYSRAYLNNHNESEGLYRDGSSIKESDINNFNITLNTALNNGNFFIGNYNYYTYDINFNNGQIIYHDYWGGNAEYQGIDTEITSFDLQNGKITNYLSFLIDLFNNANNSSIQNIYEATSELNAVVSLREYSIFIYEDDVNPENNYYQGAEKVDYTFYLTDIYEIIGEGNTIGYEFGADGGNSNLSINYITNDFFEAVVNSGYYINLSEDGEFISEELSTNSLNAIKYLITMTYFYDFGDFDSDGEYEFYDASVGTDYLDHASIKEGKNATLEDPDGNNASDILYTNNLGYNHKGIFLNSAGAFDKQDLSFVSIIKQIQENGSVIQQGNLSKNIVICTKK